jgi:hypothetical protein
MMHRATAELNASDIEGLQAIEISSLTKILVAHTLPL